MRLKHETARDDGRVKTVEIHASEDSPIGRFFHGQGSCTSVVLHRATGDTETYTAVRAPVDLHSDEEWIEDEPHDIERRY